MKILTVFLLSSISLLITSCKEEDEVVINTDIIGKWELREKGCTCFADMWQPVTGIDIEYLEFNADSTFFETLAQIPGNFPLSCSGTYVQLSDTTVLITSSCQQYPITHDIYFLPDELVFQFQGREDVYWKKYRRIE